MQSAALRKPPPRILAIAATLGAAAALGVATGSEAWGQLVPCALCLIERWPYRIVIALGLLATVAPRNLVRPLLGITIVCLLADAAVAAVHVGVEFGWWASPLPECAAPRFSGGSITERLAAMPARPSKPCDDPTFLIPGLPGVDGGDEPAIHPGIFPYPGHLLGEQQRRQAMTQSNVASPGVGGPDISRPGDLSPRQHSERLIRVDHAGEYGATRIYAGQLAVLGKGSKGDLLRHMQAQEEHHLKTFSDMIADQRVRPTALLPLWHIAGYALGAVTAAMGEKAAMACTVAVEEAIDDHYGAQIAMLDNQPALRETLEKFRSEEAEHRDIGLAHGAEQAFGYRLLSRIIKTGCKAAIAVSERV